MQSTSTFTRRDGGVLLAGACRSPLIVASLLILAAGCGDSQRPSSANKSDFNRVIRIISERRRIPQHIEGRVTLWDGKQVDGAGKRLYLQVWDVHEREHTRLIPLAPDGTYGVELPPDCLHPINARLFIDDFLGKEWQLQLDRVEPEPAASPSGGVFKQDFVWKSEGMRKIQGRAYLIGVELILEWTPGDQGESPRPPYGTRIHVARAASGLQLDGKIAQHGVLMTGFHEAIDPPVTVMNGIPVAAYTLSGTVEFPDGGTHAMLFQSEAGTYSAEVPMPIDADTMCARVRWRIAETPLAVPDQPAQ